MDSLFEKQTELFFDDSGKLCGIVIAEDFGNSYSLLSIKAPDVIQVMLDFLLQAPSFEKPYRIVVPEKDLQQTEILVPELSILLLNERGEPVSTCMGYWDRENRLMEVELVRLLLGWAEELVSHRYHLRCEIQCDTVQHS